MSFCPSCGRETQAYTAFCPYCGSRLAVPSPPPAPTQAAPRVSTPQVQKHVSHTGRNVAIGVIIILLIVGVAYALSGPSGLGSPQNVGVSGYVGTTYGTHPTDVEFTSNTGNTYYGTVSITNTDQENYNAQLPNGFQYTVTIFWNGALDTSGSCNAGTFNINQGSGAGSLAEDFTC